MSFGSSRANFQEVSDRLTELAAAYQAQGQRNQALEAENRSLKRDNASLRSQVTEAERALLGGLTGSDGDTPSDLQPGRPPIFDVGAWQRSQLGGF